MVENSFVSLFSGAGGLDLGLEMAGWNCKYASDIDPVAVSTLSRNKKYLSNALVECTDVQTTTGHNLLSKLGLSAGEVPMLVGGPPCQSWSSAGHQKGFLDPRGRLFDDFVRIAGELDVRWLMFENVRGLLTARGPDGQPGTALELIRTKLLNAGFQTQVALLNAADFGVPQRRVRLFVFGYRSGDEMTFPEVSHDKAGGTEAGNLKKWVSLGETIGRLSPLAEDEIIRPNEKLAKQLSTIPDGSGVKSPGKKEATRPGGHWGYKQGAFIANQNIPARTVTANGQQDWIRDPVLGLRRLCPRECAAIQSFPLDWTFEGKRNDQYRQIGNAVPPLLARKIGLNLIAHTAALKGTEIHKSPELIPLAPKLNAAIKYTKREQLRNGPSRAAAPRKRKTKAAVSGI